MDSILDEAITSCAHRLRMAVSLAKAKENKLPFDDIRVMLLGLALSFRYYNLIPGPRALVIEGIWKKNKKGFYISSLPQTKLIIANHGKPKARRLIGRKVMILILKFHFKSSPFHEEKDRDIEMNILHTIELTENWLAAGKKNGLF